MRFKVLISETPIPDYDTAEKLEKLGLRVPFVTSDEEFNIYAYLPEDSEVKLSTIRAIHYFEDAFMSIDERELVKHESKIEQFNSVEVGDKVKIAGYRNLVTEVEEVNEDLVTTRINLRGYVFRFVNRLNHLSKSDVVFENKEYQFNQEFKESLFIDLSEFQPLADAGDRFEYIVSVFNLVLRLKLSFTRLNVVLLFPRFGVDRLFGLTGLTGAFTLRDFLELHVSPRSLLYTLDMELYRPDRRIVTKVKNKNIQSVQELTPSSFKRITGLEDGDQYRIFNNLKRAHAALENKPLFDSKRVKLSILQGSPRLKETYPHCFTPQPHIEVKHLSGMTVEHHSLDIEELYKSLLDDGFIQIVENLDYYITIIKG